MTDDEPLRNNLQRALREIARNFENNLAQVSLPRYQQRIIDLAASSEPDADGDLVRPGALPSPGFVPPIFRSPAVPPDTVFLVQQARENVRPVAIAARRLGRRNEWGIDEGVGPDRTVMATFIHNSTPPSPYLIHDTFSGPDSATLISQIVRDSLTEVSGGFFSLTAPNRKPAIEPVVLDNSPRLGGLPADDSPGLPRLWRQKERDKVQARIENLKDVLFPRAQYTISAFNMILWYLFNQEDERYYGRAPSIRRYADGLMMTIGDYQHALSFDISPMPDTWEGAREAIADIYLEIKEFEKAILLAERTIRYTLPLSGEEE